MKKIFKHILEEQNKTVAYSAPSFCFIAFRPERTFASSEEEIGGETEEYDTEEQSAD